MPFNPHLHHHRHTPTLTHSLYHTHAALSGHRTGLPSHHHQGTNAPQVPHIPPHEMNAAVQHLILSAAVQVWRGRVCSGDSFHLCVATFNPHLELLQNQQQGRRSLDVDAAQLKRLGLDGGGSTGGCCKRWKSECKSMMISMNTLIDLESAAEPLSGDRQSPISA